MTDSNYVISDTPEVLNRPHNVTLTEGQISTILYIMEGYLCNVDDNDDEFDNDCKAIFDELEGVVDNYYNKVEQKKQPIPEWDETKEDAQENNVNYSPLKEDSEYANQVDSLIESMKEGK